VQEFNERYYKQTKKVGYLKKIRFSSSCDFCMWYCINSY